MNKNEFLNLINDHLMDKRKEYLDKYLKTDERDYKLKYMYLGRANSYLEIQGFMVGASFMETICENMVTYEDKKKIL